MTVRGFNLTSRHIAVAAHAARAVCAHTVARLFSQEICHG